VVVANLLVILGDSHGFDPVDIAAAGDAELDAAHLIGGIFHDIDMAGETDVLGIVGDESDVDDTVAVDGECVLQIIAVEADGTICDRALEAETDEFALFVVDIDIGEAILEYGVQDFAGVDEFVDTA